MPEGPEVLTISDQLYFYLGDKRIRTFTFLSGKYNTNAPDYYEELTSCFPATVVDVWCKAKFIIFQLKSDTGEDWWIINSLRMTGKWEFTETVHSRARMSFYPTPENGVFDVVDIYYNDVRSLGTFEFINSKEELDAFLDELQPGFIGRYTIDYDTFYKNIKKCNRSLLVAKLKDQHAICSGVGNYLVSEILYACKFHPSITCNHLTNSDIQTLYDECSRLLNLSYQYGGMSMRDYNGLGGHRGKFQDHLKVYGSKNPDVRSVKQGNGQTIWYVPRIQTKK